MRPRATTDKLRQTPATLLVCAYRQRAKRKGKNKAPNSQAPGRVRKRGREREAKRLSRNLSEQEAFVFAMCTHTSLCTHSSAVS
jgi:hypothetical protein